MVTQCSLWGVTGDPGECESGSVYSHAHSDCQPCALSLDKRLVFELIKVGAIIVLTRDEGNRFPRAG